MCTILSLIIIIISITIIIIIIYFIVVLFLIYLSSLQLVVSVSHVQDFSFTILMQYTFSGPLLIWNPWGETCARGKEMEAGECVRILHAGNRVWGDNKGTLWEQSRFYTIIYPCFCPDPGTCR